MPTGHQDFDLIPSTRSGATLKVSGLPGDVPSGTVRGLFVTAGSVPQAELGLDAAQLESVGFGAGSGQVLVVPTAGGVTVAVGVEASGLGVNQLRDAAASFSLAVPRNDHLALTLPGDLGCSIEDAVLAVVEGVLLPRYSFSMKQRTQPAAVAIGELTILVNPDVVASAEAALPRAQAITTATALGRDLANAPGGQLTATRLGEIAAEIGPGSGLEVEVFDQDALVELGCGGLLAVNLGSVEPARMIKLRYRPTGSDGPAVAHLTLVGKGIMYDSGGISLKPSDGTHATMKNDMSGAGSVLAAMTALRELDCPVAVTGYLMCTDNMPSGSALKLGDVITIRGGTTVEVMNTDAEGRLVMADALVLATEEPTDAIVDLATLTGATLRALGPDVAGVMGTSQPLIEQVKASGDRTDEPVWQFPMINRYRSWFDSTIADMTNLGGVHAGQIAAALFLREFVGDVPWAHIDIAGTSQADAQYSWRPKGATGFGTRLLIDLALNFQPVAD